MARVTMAGGANTAGNRVVFYAALADTPESALVAIRKAVKSADYVEMTDGKLSPETARALDLKPGVAKAM